MKKNIYLLLTIALSFISGCNSITFVQYEQPGEHTTINRWHHSTLNGMVEISKPLDMQALCKNRAWTKVTTEYTLYNGLVSLIVPRVEPIVFYSAWTNKVQCYEPPLLPTAEK